MLRIIFASLTGLSLIVALLTFRLPITVDDTVALAAVTLFESMLFVLLAFVPMRFAALPTRTRVIVYIGSIFFSALIVLAALGALGFLRTPIVDYKPLYGRK